MPGATFIPPSTSVSTVSTVATNHNPMAVQSGPYTKAQFQSTMEGSRSLRNGKEIEQLLRDYPAALELYRTGKYKVKVKYEADVERVILVEKRTSKGTTNNDSLTNDLQEKDSSIADVSINGDKSKQEVKKGQGSTKSRSRTHSRDHVAPTISANNGTSSVHTTTSSRRITSHPQPKVNHHRTSSKDREMSVTSQTKQQHVAKHQHGHRRTQSRDSPSTVSYTKQPEKKSHPDYSKMVVPFVPNDYAMRNIWNQPQAMQPYFSNPILQQQRANIYVPHTFLAQQHPHFHQPYSYGQQPPPALAYQKPSAYTTAPTIKSTGNPGNASLHSTHNYSSSSRSVFDSNNGVRLPPSFHTFHPNQQQFQPAAHHSMYHSQIPMRMPTPVAWPTATHGPVGTAASNHDSHTNHRRGSKDRALSVDKGLRSHPPSHTHVPRQQQTGPAVEHYHHHRHHHHHHRLHPTNVPMNPVVPTGEVAKNQSVISKQTGSIVSNVNGEKLTIRQLNEIFIQSDPTGRLPYRSVPSLLQRFGIALTENDLTSAAQDLEYNVTEPISARRLVHVLVKLGKIAKSTSQQRPAASPSLLPEDREVTDILTQRQAASHPTQTFAYSNPWH